MELKGKYKLAYTLDKEPKDLIFEIELKLIESLMRPGQNVWCGAALLDGKPYDKVDLSHCVEAKLAAERIGKAMRDEIKAKANEKGQSFRIKKEELI